MSTIAALILAFVALLAGAVVAWLAVRSQSAGLAQRRAELEQEVAASRSQIDQLQREVSTAREARAAVEATLASERQSTQEKLALLTAASEQMRAQFAALASDALRSNNASFLQLAKSELESQQKLAQGELEKREQAVQTLVKPIADSLKSVDDNLRALETKRVSDHSNLTTLVESLYESQNALRVETGNLVKAMREPQARGRWGELQLRRCLELAGMLDYCDFKEQVSVTSDEKMLRPDVVVKLPGDKNLVVDSKVPLAAYLAALEATDEAARNVQLQNHARHVKQHIDMLSAKSYWAQFAPTPDFVVLFLPGEVFFRAALDADPELIEYGVERKVIVTSPTTLIALMRAVAYGWNQKNLAESARKISEAGKLLYQRLATMAGYFEDVGKKLGSAVEAYNKSVGSMERSVFPVARKLPELDRSLSSEELPDLKQVEKTPRQLESPDWSLSAEADPVPLLGSDSDQSTKQ